MAPRAPQPVESIVRELRGGRERLKTEPYRFGSPHFTHAAVHEGGVYRVRRLEYDRAEGDAYAKRAREHGEPFMPEHAELFMKPTGAIVLEAATLDELLTRLKERWPLD